MVFAAQDLLRDNLATPANLKFMGASASPRAPSRVRTPARLPRRPFPTTRRIRFSHPRTLLFRDRPDDAQKNRVVFLRRAAKNLKNLTPPSPLPSPLSSLLSADCSVYATANGFATLALNRDKVGAFVKSSRVVYKGWLHGYERAARVTSAKLVATAAGAAKSTLGPSLVYGCTMRAAAAAGLPSLVAVGGANVATPLIVSKMGGRLGALPAHALAARALPIAAHCVIEWGLFQRFKEHMVRANAAARGVPRSRAKKVVDGALTGGVCAAAATPPPVLARTPRYGGKLFARAVAADSAATAARLGGRRCG